MSIVVISDVHIHKNQDPADQLLCRFFEHEKVQKADKIILLGDIFDLMAGPHREYYDNYSNFFQYLLKYIEEGKEIHYFEGNHDMHLDKLFSNFFKENSLTASKFFHHTKAYIFKKWGKTYFFSHGDDIEIENYTYKIYKAFITSPPLRFTANYLMPYKILHDLGEKASDDSKKRRGQSYDEAPIRQRFRVSAIKAALKGYDYIVCGHSHIKDEYFYDQDGVRFHYLNNGFALKSNTFIEIDQEGHRFIDL